MAAELREACSSPFWFITKATAQSHEGKERRGAQGQLGVGASQVRTPLPATCAPAPQSRGSGNTRFLELHVPCTPHLQDGCGVKMPSWVSLVTSATPPLPRAFALRINPAPPE